VCGPALAGKIATQQVFVFDQIDGAFQDHFGAAPVRSAALRSRWPSTSGREGAGTAARRERSRSRRRWLLTMVTNATPSIAPPEARCASKKLKLDGDLGEAAHNLLAGGWQGQPARRLSVANSCSRFADTGARRPTAGHQRVSDVFRW